MQTLCAELNQIVPFQLTTNQQHNDSVVVLRFIMPRREDQKRILVCCAASVINDGREQLHYFFHIGGAAKFLSEHRHKIEPDAVVRKKRRASIGTWHITDFKRQIRLKLGCDLPDIFRRSVLQGETQIDLQGFTNLRKFLKHPQLHQNSMGLTDTELIQMIESHSANRSKVSRRHHQQDANASVFRNAVASCSLCSCKVYERNFGCGFVLNTKSSCEACGVHYCMSCFKAMRTKNLHCFVCKDKMTAAEHWLSYASLP